jgi:hypothetical protein
VEKLYRTAQSRKGEAEGRRSRSVTKNLLPGKGKRPTGPEIAISHRSKLFTFS